MEESGGHSRLFVAIPLPESVRGSLERMQEHLRSGLRNDCIRWTKREQFHLTLRFLGNVVIEQIEELKTALRQASKDIAGFRLRATQVGFFPERGFPRVVWVGVEEKTGLL